jgi:hypothetical protein
MLGKPVTVFEYRSTRLETANASSAFTFADLVDHYIATELACHSTGQEKSHATRVVYKDFLLRWIRPVWGHLDIRDIRTVAVEHWLRQLARCDGLPLAPSTKAKLRNLMSVVFNHAIRYRAKID